MPSICRTETFAVEFDENDGILMVQVKTNIETQDVEIWAQVIAINPATNQQAPMPIKLPFASFEELKNSVFDKTFRATLEKCVKEFADNLAKKQSEQILIAKSSNGIRRKIDFKL